MTIKTDLELLKKEVEDMKQIHTRLDTAIEKLTDVSSCVNRMLAVHEEKLARQEEAIVDAEQKIEVRRAELSKQIDELHSRITTNTKELMNLGTAQHEKHSKEIKRLSSSFFWEGLKLIIEPVETSFSLSTIKMQGYPSLRKGESWALE